jgi:sugar phosphate isomerase/epimerase
MSSIRIACQTYTWEMLGDEWQGSVADLLDWIAGAGYAGLEITNNMIGEFADRPDDFAAELRKRSLELAAFAYATTGFTDPDRWEEDLAGARQALEFLRRFPNPRLGLGGAAHPTRENARGKLDQALQFYNEVGRLAAPAGISVNVHPHSHHGSLLETAEEYQTLLDHLDPQTVSFGPDTGHIVRGGQDLLTCLRTHLPRLTHLHFKDATATGEWVALGEGVCDFPAVMSLLESTHYDGWVVAEEESAEARRHGIAAVRKNRAYLRSIGY